MSDALVESSREGAACVLTLRREAKLNALSTALEEELGRALTSEAVRASACVVLTGGARVFSAGADVSEMRGLDPAAILAYYAATGDVYERVAALAQPSVSAIAGYCLGGGLELALGDRLPRGRGLGGLRPARGRDRDRPELRRHAPARAAARRGAREGGGAAARPLLGAGGARARAARPRSSTTARRCRARSRWPSVSRACRRWRSRRPSGWPTCCLRPRARPGWHSSGSPTGCWPRPRTPSAPRRPSPRGGSRRPR